MERFWKTSSIENCLLELLLNSLKAEATAIAIRIDADKRRIQVIDNGFGIAKNELRYVGENFVENKMLENDQSREINSPIPGKNLIKIRGLSSCLIIMSQARFSSDTYGKFFINGQIVGIRRIETRPACGTTVIVYISNNFRGWDEINFFAIRYIIAYLALVNTQVSFSVRDETTSSILLRIGKRQKYTELLRVVCEFPSTEDKVNLKKIFLGDTKIKFFWGISCINSRKIQQILLNLRPVQCPSLNNFITKIVRKMSDEKANFGLENVFFLFYIECSDSEFKVSMKNDQLIVEFCQIDKIIDSVRKVLMSHLRKSKLSEPLNYKPIISPLIFRPTGGILGVKQKRSFMTKACKQILKNRRNIRKEIEEKKILSGIKISGILKNEDSHGINGDTGDAKHKSLKNLTPLKRNVYYEILEEGQTSQECLKKFQQHPGESTPGKKNYKILKVSQISQRCIEKSQKNLRDSLTTSPHENREENRWIRNYDYNNDDTSWTSQTSIDKSSTTIKEIFSIGECSQWSNWTYRTEKRLETAQNSNNPIIWTRFKNFLPPNLHTLLPHGNVKLIRRDSLENEGVSLNLNLNYRPQDLGVRPCTKKTAQIRLKPQSLKSMKVLNQINKEFIIALTKQDDKKLLLMIDQHAMHERIRYENLLRAYKRDAKNPQIISLNLHRPIMISDFSEKNCSLLSTNRDLIMIQYGLNLTHHKVNTLLISAVPRCFLKKTFYTDNTKLEIALRKLLRELIENLINGGTKKFLPLTIHEAIASEACHGAIKFGDPLTPSQCDILVSHWKETDVPNRCAHGRPSIIPLLELSSYRINKYKTVFQEKLNFAALLKPRACTSDERQSLN